MWMRQDGFMNRNYTSKFDADLRFGQEGEEWLVLLAKHKKLEIKRDREWVKSGNLYFEYESYGKISGFAGTEADYYAYILSGVDGEAKTVYLWEINNLRNNLRRLLADKKIRKVCGGDNKATKAVLLPLTMLHELN